MLPIFSLINKISVQKIVGQGGGVAILGVTLRPILRNSGVEREHLASPPTRQQSPPGLLHFWVPESQSKPLFATNASWVDPTYNSNQPLANSWSHGFQPTFLASRLITWKMHSLKLTVCPWKGPIAKGNEKVFQPTIFRCKLLVSGGVMKHVC